jgi:hypothetical protein
LPYTLSFNQTSKSALATTAHLGTVVRKGRASPEMGLRKGPRLTRRFGDLLDEPVTNLDTRGLF